ncbi:MAG: hypothetical protein H0V80_07220 [Acidobacteria bacterium]|nr:hypothetical protein [Acidobacteriota bacterium]
MFRNLVRLVVLGLLVHAAVRIVPEFWHYFKFKDSVVEAATFGGRKTPEEIRALVVSLAEQHQVPIAEPDVLVVRQGGTTSVSTAWTAQLEYVPRRFYPYEFVVDVEGRPQRFGGMIP